MNKKLFIWFSLIFFFGALYLFSTWENRISGFTDLTGPWSVGLSKIDDLHDLPLYLENNIIDSLNSESPFNADFVADPFFVKDSNGIHLFVEHVFKEHGDISYFFSKDLSIPFKFVDVVLDESFHLSYPQVFQYEGSYYMLPETQGSGEVILYTTDSFPKGWKKLSVLIKPKIQDPTLYIRSGDEFYLFGSEDGKLHCWKANFLTGNYELIAQNLLVGTESRPGGRIFEHDGKLLIPIQNSSKGYGTGLSLYEINFEEEIRLDRYTRFFLGPQPEIDDFSHGMHHADVQFIDGEYYVAFDGNNKVGDGDFSLKFFLKYNLLNLYNEIIQFRRKFWL